MPTKAIISLTIFSLLCLDAVLQAFFPLFKWVIPEILSGLLMGSALASGGSILEPTGMGFIRHRGKF